jgi:hypothetical protein
MRKNLFLLTCLLASATLLAQTNLLQPVSEKWEAGRNAENGALFEVIEYDGQPAFHIHHTAAEGYTMFRDYPKVAPGEYTFLCQAFGDSKYGLYAEIYSFAQDGTPTMIMSCLSPAGSIAEPMTIYDTLNVPQNSAYLRVGVGIAGGPGEGTFWNPQLLAGKLPKPAAQTQLLPIQAGWIAKWIYLKNDPGVSRVDFTKSFTLDGEPVSAKVQLTADNGYEFLVNGKFVGSDVDWRNTEVYDLKNLLHRGDNTIEVHVLNYDDLGGLLFQGEIVDASGKSTEIISDESWTISLPDGASAEMHVHGQPPVVPWGDVQFHQIVPPKTLALKPIEQIIQVTAGEVIKYVFPLPDTIAGKKDPKLGLRFTDAEGRETPLSAFGATIRIVPELKRFYIELATSSYAMPGTYRCEIIGNGFVVPGGEVTILPAALPQTAGALLPHPSLSNTMENDSFTQSLFTYSTYSANGEENYRSWTATGGHLYEAHIQCSHWNDRNRFTSTEVETMMMRILENDPCASIVLKFRLDVPGWWASQHPDDLFRSSKGRAAQQSFCSDAWRRDAIDAVCATIEELSARPVGQAISGALLMGYRGGEFQLWGEDVGEYDCSKTAQEKFNEWLAERGEAPVTLPDNALTWPLQPVDKQGEHLRDLFFRFVAERQAENLAFFVKEFRQHFGDRYRIGMYYGYGLEYCGANNRMLLAGHLGLEKLLDDAAPDLLSCPLSYGLRPANRSHAFMYPVDSARIHGALPIGENDIRNYRNPELADSSGQTILSLADSIADNRRIRVFEAAHGALVRYLALHPNVDWYFDQPMVRSIREDNELVMGLKANPPDGGNDDQVVLVANYLEWTRGWRLPDKSFQTFAGNARDTLMHTGRSVAFVTMTDYLPRIANWKNAMIPLPGLLTDSQRVALEAAYGKLPPIRLDDGALVLRDGNWSVLPATATERDIWQALATQEALAAGIDTIWYIGANFTYTWDGKHLEKR